MLPSQQEVLQSARRSGGARDQLAQNFAGNFRLRNGSGLLRRRGQRLVFRQHVAGGIEHREAMIAQPECDCRLHRGRVQRVRSGALFGLALVFRLQRGEKTL